MAIIGIVIAVWYGARFLNFVASCAQSYKNSESPTTEKIQAFKDTVGK